VKPAWPLRRWLATRLAAARRVALALVLKVEDAQGHQHDALGRFTGPGGGGGAHAEDPAADWASGEGADEAGSKPRQAPRPRSKSAGRLNRFRACAVRRRVLHGLRNEAVLAEALDAHNLPDSEPADVVLLVNADGQLVTDREFIMNHMRRREDVVRELERMAPDDRVRPAYEQWLAAHQLHFFEVKTLITQGGAGAIHMSGAAVKRKERWAKRYAAPFHTVAFDDRRGKKHSGHKLYFRYGVGSVKLSEMEKAGDFGDILGKAGETAGG
jgi:hypothetical protein